MSSMGVSSKGDFGKTRKWLEKNSRGDIFTKLSSYGEIGVRALRRATPVDSGLAAESWGYRIVKTRTGYAIEWFNRDIENGVPVIILIQYGHGTGTGGYVPGRDIINPAMRPVFQAIADDIWRRLTSE